MAEPAKTPNANGSDIPNDSNTEPKPEYITSAQLNAALTAREKRFESRLEDLFKSHQPAPAPEPSKKGAEGDEVSKRIAALEKALEASKAEATAAKSKHLDTTLRSKLSDELTKHGIASPKHAMALLLDSEKRVAWGEDEKLVWRGDDGTEAPLSDGLKAWAKGPDAKLYMAARGTVGSGDRGAPPVNGNKTKGSITKAEGAQMLFDLVTGRVSE